MVWKLKSNCHTLSAQNVIPRDFDICSLLWGILVNTEYISVKIA